MPSLVRLIVRAVVFIVTSDNSAAKPVEESARVLPQKRDYGAFMRHPPFLPQKSTQVDAVLGIA